MGKLQPVRDVARSLVGATAAGAATFALAAFVAPPLAMRLVPLARAVANEDLRWALGGLLSTVGVLVAAPLVSMVFGRLTDMKPAIVAPGSVLVGGGAALLVDSVTLGADGLLLGGWSFLIARLGGYAAAGVLAFLAGRWAQGRAAAAEAADEAERRKADEERRAMLAASEALAAKVEARTEAAAPATAVEAAKPDVAPPAPTVEAAKSETSEAPKPAAPRGGSSGEA